MVVIRFISRGIWKVRVKPSAKVWCIFMPSMRRPSKTISPLVGGNAPETRSNRVVLPAPFGPINPVTVPRATDREQWSRARTPPKSLTRRRT